ncbi:MAG TPA: hypothetical protein VLA12_04370, partial [Planctomycetaceae bacterium]|nr:hypothetical protein [Planctomycetaceae bacterium]
LGHLKQTQLAAEQIRELQALYDREQPGTDDRLYTGWYLSNVQFGPYGKRDEGLRQMQIVIREYEQTHSDGWPSHAAEPFEGYVSMFEQLNRHAQAEKFVKQHIAQPQNDGQKNWLQERLLSVYASALEADSRVSLGEREELYHNLIPSIVAHAESGDDNHRYQVLQRLHQVFRTAKRKNFPTLRADMRKYAFETLPTLLKRQHNNYHSMVNGPAHLMKELLDERTGLEFLIERFEKYPERFDYSWQNPWNQFGYLLGRWREEVGNELGDLEPRLLAIVLTELRKDLETRNSRSRNLYQKHNRFWPEKEADFAGVAEEVLAKHRDSARSVRYIADYFWNGLEHRDRAIEIMFVAMNDNQLDDNGLARLVDWLHHPDVRRYAESISILEDLIARNSINMHYRCELITAYHHALRIEQRSRLMTETIELFRQEGRWNEANLHQLALCVHDIELHQQTIELVEELIPMHQRSHPTRGIGQGTLPMYYMWLADAHSRLKQTEPAVDAAASAIVSWGPSHDQRRNAFEKLDEVTKAAEDLDDYVALINKRAAETGEDSSIIRRSIGKAYAARNQHDKAIAQLRISVELQPGDLETHKLLLTSYDALGDREGAVSQLLDLIDVDRHTLSHYDELEKRLRDDDAQAERAATAVVEAAPSEAEHHQKLAVIRERQQRFAAAVQEWQQVAELRSLEPNGLINLAKAQFKADQPEAARETIDKLQKTEWPSRFDNDVRNALNELNQLEKTQRD